MSLIVGTQVRGGLDRCSYLWTEDRKASCQVYSDEGTGGSTLVGTHVEYVFADELWLLSNLTRIKKDCSRFEDDPSLLQQAYQLSCYLELCHYG